MKKQTSGKKNQTLARRIGLTLAICVWVAATFTLSSFVVQALVQGVIELGFGYIFGNLVIAQTVLSVVIYALAISLAIFVPYKIFKDKTTWEEMGLKRKLPTWMDLGIAPLAYVGSIIAIGILMYGTKALVPGFDIEQKQEVGFDPTMVKNQLELFMVYFTLGVLAPVAEEILVRGYMYGKIRRYCSTAITVIITAMVFSALHLGLGALQDLQWNVALATFVLGVMLGSLRAATGCLWAGILLHMIQNTVAFLILFAVPYSVGM